MYRRYAVCGFNRVQEANGEVVPPIVPGHPFTALPIKHGSTVDTGMWYGGFMPSKLLDRAENIEIKILTLDYGSILDSRFWVGLDSSLHPTPKRTMSTEAAP